MTSSQAKKSLLTLPPEIILLIAAHLNCDKGGYVFSKPLGSNTWFLYVTKLTPGVSMDAMFKRYGCRLLFQIRPFAAYAALMSAHPYFKAVIVQSPLLMPPKPLTPEPLIVVDEVQDAIEKSGMRRREKVQQRKYWVGEGTDEEPGMEGWGMVWLDGQLPDDRWPLGLRRLG